MSGSNSTSGSQLVEMQGTLKLTYPMLPELGCLLASLQSDGCCANVMFQYLPAELVNSWRKCLQPNRPLRVKIENYQQLMDFEVDALVTGIIDLEHHSEIQLRFQKMTPIQHMMINQALISSGEMPAVQVPDGANVIRQGPVLVDRNPDASGSNQNLPAFQQSTPVDLTTDAPPPLIIGAPSAPPPVIVQPILRKKIGAVLVQMGQLTEAQVEDAAKQARMRGEKIGRYLVRSGLIAPDVMCRALALQTNLPMTDISDLDLNDQLGAIFPYATMLRHTFVPFDQSRAVVCVAAANPLNALTIQELEQACGRKVEMFLACEDLIARHLNKVRARQQVVPRKFVRYDVHVPITYQFCNRFGVAMDEIRHDGVTVNISEGGLMIEGAPAALAKPDDLLRRGTCASICIVNAHAQEIKFLCRIKSVHENGKLWHFGCEVLEISAEDKRRLKELCMKSLLDRVQSKKFED